MGTAASPLNLLCCYFLLLALPPSIPFHSTESLQPQYLTHSFLSLSLTPYLIKSTDATDRTACLIYSAYLNPDRPCLPYPPSHSDPSRKPSRSHRLNASRGADEAGCAEEDAAGFEISSVKRRRFES